MYDIFFVLLSLPGAGVRCFPAASVPRRRRSWCSLSGAQGQRRAKSGGFNVAPFSVWPAFCLGDIRYDFIWQDLRISKPLVRLATEGLLAFSGFWHLVLVMLQSEASIRTVRTR